MTVLLVDWLGRGGIAETSAAWRIELESAGEEVVVITRPDRDLASSVPPSSSRSSRGRIRSHLAVVEAAVRAVESMRPAVVVVQNYIIPVLEERLHRAAHRVGARLVMVVHDHRLHSVLAGSHYRLPALLHSADTLLCHSEFVGAGVHRMSGREPVVTPLPMQLGLLGGPRTVPTMLEPEERVAIHFGVVKRRYKGSRVVRSLAGATTGWRFVTVGAGADQLPHPHVSINAFVPGPELLGLVERADVALFPYSFATQSGSIVLAHAVGTVPIASAVGGIPEQVRHQETGLLIDADASVEEWRNALELAEDAAARTSMAAKGQASVADDHARFVTTMRALTS